MRFCVRFMCMHGCFDARFQELMMPIVAHADIMIPTTPCVRAHDIRPWRPTPPLLFSYAPHEAIAMMDSQQRNIDDAPLLQMLPPERLPIYTATYTVSTGSSLSSNRPAARRQQNAVPSWTYSEDTRPPVSSPPKTSTTRHP